MRSLITILFIALLSGITTFFLPWWMVAVCTFLVVVTMRQGPGQGFRAGFAGIALLWLIVILCRDLPNEHILSTRMAKVFGMPNSGLFILINILLGGLVGGLAGWSGGVMFKYFRK